MSLELALLAGYCLLFLAVGLAISRRVKDADDFLVAGRSLGPGLVGASFLAANIGGGSTLGATGLGYRFGWGAWWWVGCAGIGTAILSATVGPKIWTLARENGWRTVGDFLDSRYSRATRGLVAALLWAATLLILAGQLMGISKIVEELAHVTKWQGCLIAGSLVSVYFVAGGLLSSAWVNLIQLSVKLVGFAVAVPVTIGLVGGWAALRPAMENAQPLALKDVVYVAILVPSFIVSPGLIQKLYGARDARAVRIGVGWNAAGLMLFAFVPVLLGLAARTAFPALPDRESALPHLMTSLLPPWLGALTLAAVLSAELSASDAILFMLSSSLSIDLYKTFLDPAASDRRLLLVGRLAATAGALAAVGLALSLPSIITALTGFYALLAVALAAPFLVGLYSSRPGSGRALAAIGTSISVALLMLAAPLGALKDYAALFGIVTGFAIMLAP